MTDPELARLRWRCRRGMGELDLLLQRWLQTRWPVADAACRADFRRLLDAEDDRLWAWVIGREPAPDEGLARLIDELA
ncbi:MAG: succinate dehydrogenase assembly factor 2 [Wenzhouxiangellaceae bacterium]|nr:succinate dehydrogenase assembly factor 2 [Wenzhouxiangellaceae bacterium]